MRWIYSVGHKDIGTLYFIFGIWCAIIGRSFSFIIRIELRSPGLLLEERGGHLYNTIVTAHALIMIFFFVMPVLIGGFGNWLVPLSLGVTDIQFPRLNNFRFWTLPVALELLLMSFLRGGGVGTG